MAGVGVSSIKSERSSRTFTESLYSAFQEWILLFLLFVNAAFSFLTTKFAHYCDLQTPCLICSRLDRILGNERLAFYWDMICHKHKSEISSLVLCHAHSKLVDIHGICENCLFSFAMMNKSNAEMNRLLVGKLGADSDFGPSEEEQEFLSEGSGIKKSSMKLCSCCNKPWTLKDPKQTLLQTTSTMFQLAELDVPLSGIIDSLKNIGDGSSKRINHGIGDLSHVEYTELKISSDTESKVPSDDDGMHALGSKLAGARKKSIAEPFKDDPLINISSSHTAVKLEEQGPVEQTSASLAEKGIDATKTEKEDEVMAGHDLVEINYQNSKFEDKDASTSIVEIIYFDGFPFEANNGATLEKLSSDACEHKPPWLSSPSKPSENDTTVREASEAREKYSEEILEVEAEAITMTEKPVEANLISSHPSPQVSDVPDIGEVYKLAADTQGRQLSGVLTEQWLSKDSSLKVSGDFKNLISLLSIPRGNDQTSTPDMMPVIPLNDDESLKTLDARQKKISPERNELNPSEPSVIETNVALVKDSEETLKVNTEMIRRTENPMEANILSTTDSSPWVPNLLDLGEAYKLAVGNRGRQLSGVLTEQWLSKDTSSRVSEDLKNLFSQLSAPRSNDQSSAADSSPNISLNREDSMKTLDAIHKRISLDRNESGLSQDGSLVGEIDGESTFDRLKRQIEHDRRALSTLYKELEEERNASAIATNQAMAMITRLQEEKATLQMEALQYLRMMEEQAEYDMEALQKSNDLLSEREKEIHDLEDELDFYRIKYGEENEISENLNVHLKSEPDLSAVRFKDSAIGFEDERLHIHESLKRLKKKLGLASGEGMISELPDSESRCAGEEEANIFESTQNIVSSCRDDSLGMQEEQETPPDEDTREGDCTGGSPPGFDLTSVKNEVCSLQKRLGVLEADRNFLEKIVRHLSAGEEGLQFVRDIATHLQEIRNAMSKAS
ncbi:hypothetical protein SAY86_007624 [Trapa natans]|uniref:GTD-binding domain-containing protein n=1 Tax=Trapa natans TaxID=22666 RepID=A0AAN7LLQ9_TRANT|nr:hypothetical protein SAY86_007624 [Trapa natans]